MSSSFSTTIITTIKTKTTRPWYRRRHPRLEMKKRNEILLLSVCDLMWKETNKKSNQKQKKGNNNQKKSEQKSLFSTTHARKKKEFYNKLFS